MNPFQELGKPEEWMQWASCPEVDPDLFFPDQGGNVNIPKSICHGCAVQAECLEFAMRNNEEFGVFGGLTAKERQRLRRAAA